MIEFVGPLPPPVHGFSWVSKQVLSGLQKNGEVDVIDRALPRLEWSRKFVLPFVLLVQVFVFFFRLVFFRPASVYLACSGGWGMAFDAVFVSMANIFNIPVYIHHHSFFYINYSNWLNILCLKVMRNCNHIVLCERMRALLARAHVIDVNRIVALSNAAFLESEMSDGFNCEHARGNTSHVCVGFLSNITIEKGIIDFFELAGRFSATKDRVEFVVGGPVAESIKDIFFAELEKRDNVVYVGAVYGKEKDAFFKRLDLLAFPTKYQNEAEPVTILEAFRAGVPVIANHRGCIATMLDESSGLGVVEAKNFSEDAESLIRGMVNSPSYMVSLKCGARKRFIENKNISEKKYEWILDKIERGKMLEDD